MTATQPARKTRSAAPDSAPHFDEIDGYAHAPLIIDVAGLELTEADRRRLAHPLVGGVVHFARNWRDRAQLTALNAEIKAVRPDLLICVDHEGGRVQRFRTDGFTHLPPMRALGELWNTQPLEATNAATALGFVLAAELRACGVDFSFAPVLDLDHGASSVIGDRSFHRDPRVVALLAKSVAHGLLLADMAHCGKHFPGHGHVQADSHVDVPVDRRGLKAILGDDAEPYRWLSGTLTAVMPAHVIYSRVDRRPAGFSRKWLREILRERLRFMGAIFSDDLSMAGARRIEGRTVGFAEATLAALDAGCDLVLLCNQSVVDGGAPLDHLLDALTRAREAGLWQPSDSSELRRRALLPQLPPLTWDELMHDVGYQEQLMRLP
ncbi:MAG: beta-N-acetylhexosaminidase [Comamonas sp.]